jgi:hypothetical protein
MLSGRDSIQQALQDIECWAFILEIERAAKEHSLKGPPRPGA